MEASMPVRSHPQAWVKGFSWATLHPLPGMISSLPPGPGSVRSSLAGRLLCRPRLQLRQLPQGQPH